MATIPHKELRNNVGEVLRRAEAGEELVVGNRAFFVGNGRQRRIQRHVMYDWIGQRSPGHRHGSRLHRVAVSPLCRQYVEQCKRSYGTTASSNNGELRAHFYMNTLKHATGKTVIRFYGFTGQPEWT